MTGGAPAVVVDTVEPTTLPPREPRPRTRYDAVLLVSFGGPEGQEDVLPFLRNVTRGRGVPDERLEEVAQHYRAFGGVSPINAQNRALREAIRAELADRGVHLPVLWGNRNWDPYLADALREAHDAGHRRLLALVTSAYSSYSGCRQYREDIARALTETGLEGELSVDKVRQYFDHPGFVAPFVEAVRDGLSRTRAALPDADLGSQVRVLFVTHSIPSSAAAASGPPQARLGPDGAYGAQHRAVAATVMAALDGDLRHVPWELVFQSRSGAPSTPWLEPDVNDAVADAAHQGVRGVVLVPLGFVSDHMEVRWDLDEEATATAHEHGLHAVRVPTPGVHAAFVAGLVDLVLERHEAAPAEGVTVASSRRSPEHSRERSAEQSTERSSEQSTERSESSSEQSTERSESSSEQSTERSVERVPSDVAPRPALTPLGPWYDVCRAGCCPNPRGVRPAVAGLLP